MRRRLPQTPPAPDSRTVLRALIAGAAATAVLALAPGASAADHPTGPAPRLTDSPAGRSAAQRAAKTSGTLHTLAHFFATSGAHPGPAASTAGATPGIEGPAVPVYTLSAAFVAGRPGAPIARLDFLASTAVASDGRKASVWTVPHGSSWQVVNIATGDDEARYAARGAAALPGGTVFREPQINGWYVVKGARVLPLDAEAVRAVGARGTTLPAYQHRVHQAYGDKLPGSAYATKGEAGGYAESAGPQRTATRPATRSASAASRSAAAAPGPNRTSLLAGGAGALVLGLGALSVRRRARHTGRSTAISSSRPTVPPGPGTA
ncbi:hypothetical protein [Streptomyces sp. NBC_00859]|uniref:hypothetical protein n=1 Tax=Streptomyces sp. NBC_00859 TaxID=2903682 RepID=UPI00386FBA60|nr:hypothetical protein OG584_18390 [Streptomyces sp. NBC_00859]